MHPLPLLLAIIGIAVPVLAAPPLSLHPGSTRDWVKYSGTRPDSVRYRLEFLDSTSRTTISNHTFTYLPEGATVYASKTVERRDVTIYWRVRITLIDSPSVKDSAVLHVASTYVAFDLFRTGGNTRILNLAWWSKPSQRFTIDVQNNPVAEVKQFESLSGSTPLPFLATGTWDLAVTMGEPDRRDSKIRDDGSIMTATLGSGYSSSAPMVSYEDDVGITGWLSKSSYWKLKAVDGTPLPATRGGFGHRLKSGECWVYRDSSSSMYPGMTTSSKGFVSLELLAPPSDSSGWTRLKVRKSFHPDSGTPSDTTLVIDLDTIHHVARFGPNTYTHWGLGSKNPIGSWAVSLLKHALDPTSSISRYQDKYCKQVGEVPNSGTRTSYQMIVDTSIGATSIVSSGETWGVLTSNSNASWTLVTHSLDNTPLSALAAPARPVRDLAWLRARIAQDPSLEVVRIGLDGTRSVARGAAVSKLLERRGMGIVQVQDGQELVTLRVVKP